ncbi:ABC transporter ATP-binding protein [Oleispirillum naphthae]|uniref:ABC transporter ATP-binding protein n=1 Tax=Oleispirillum naphthae TaxID=2838853 RepID=UPI0030823FD8
MFPVLKIDDLQTHFFTRTGIAKAIDGVGFHIDKGEIVCVVGESGCGKSMTALSVLRLVPHPGRIVGGEIWLDGQNLMAFSEREMREVRGDRVSMIFQEPMVSLNPAFTIGNQLIEAVRVHRKASRAEAWERSVEMLRRVDLPSPEARMNAYPHELSGGMRQRVMIAEALLLDPVLLLADEPTTALDVTVQAQVLDVMVRAARESGTAVMMITHNLAVVSEIADRVVVMYAGRVVEQGTTEEIFTRPAHPYTQGLLRAIPTLSTAAEDDAPRQPLYEMGGLVPSLTDLPPGCAFCPRCSAAIDLCAAQKPPAFPLGETHAAACWLRRTEG